MEQRRLRLGDIVDDYCPRERRITNHAIVAMIDEQVKQTRCQTCDADHDYKQAKVPVQRKRKDASALEQAQGPPRRHVAESEDVEETASAAADMIAGDAPEAVLDAVDDSDVPDDAGVEPPEDEGPVHRPLIRATLPRPEGQMPERKAPDFTIRQPGLRRGRFDGTANGGNRDGNQRRPGRGPQAGQGGPPRFGGSRQGQRQDGNQPSGPGGQRQGRPGGGRGRKRGR